MAASTIYALSSAPGRAAIAVVRISGPSARASLQALIGPDRFPRPRTVAVRQLTREGAVLDRAMILWLPGPATATGDDIVELHLHGGPAVVRSVLGALAGLPDLRMALPGEFTKRGFLNGKLDLTQAEGLADLIDAETEHQAAQALAQLDGSLAQLYESWRTRLISGLAYIEAVIDFPDEDVPDSAALAATPDLKSVLMDVEAHLADSHRGEILRDGLSVAILGRPNSGKSSLLNVLAKRDIAIVSSIAGTTRDVLEARLNLQGYSIVLADTAGLRDTEEDIESEGIRRALDRAQRSQVRMVLIDPESYNEAGQMAGHLRDGDLLVWSKADLGIEPPPAPAGAFDTLTISTKTGAGVQDLVVWLARKAEALAGSGQGPVITRARHREALQDAMSALARGVQSLDKGLDLAAEDLRLAARAIGRITGRVDVEDVLDVVFREFCIGK